MKAATNSRHRIPATRTLTAGGWLQTLLVQIASQALRDLNFIDARPKTAVHSLRKRMKKLQSLLRFAEPVVAQESLATIRAGIREIKAALTFRRDADVLAALGRDLGFSRGAPHAKRPDSTMLDAFLEELVLSMRQMDLAALSWNDVTEGYLKTCRRARKAWKKAREHPSVKTLHTCRKRVKEQYHQSLALHRWLGQDGRLRRMRRLGSLLGRRHDLDLFASTLAEKSGDGAARKVCHKVGSRRKKLTRRIFHRAEKLFSGSLSKSKHRLTARLRSKPVRR
jgi:CHAD domain-containing protein